MRPHLVFALLVLPTVMATQAQAQSRYGPESPIPPVAPAPLYGATLTWTGKTQMTAPDGPQAAHPEAMSAWAQRQAQPAGQPAAAALPPPPSTPQPIAGSATLRSAAPPPPPLPPVQTAALPALPAPQSSLPQPAAQPQYTPSAFDSAPQNAPQSAPPAAPQAPAARPYPGYGVRQIPVYPGYQTGASIPPPVQTATLQPGAPRTEMTLQEVPSIPSLADYDRPVDQPRRRDTDETSQR